MHPQQAPQPVLTPPRDPSTQQDSSPFALGEEQAGWSQSVPWLRQGHSCAWVGTVGTRSPLRRGCRKELAGPGGHGERARDAFSCWTTKCNPKTRHPGGQWDSWPSFPQPSLDALLPWPWHTASHRCWAEPHIWKLSLGFPQQGGCRERSDVPDGGQRG